jgi:serine/threonine protein kinase/tetratricopeptide (TPR) repeat protein
VSHSESQSNRVLELAEEFLERYRKGERPSLREYIERHPDLAADIKDVFPAMAMLENIAVNDDSLEANAAADRGRGRLDMANRQLGDFRIIREIGHGGMGIVYEAEQVSLGRHVALKVLPNQAMADDKQKRRFEREARAAAKLHHTNIVPVFGVGEHEGLPYYVMQFIQGLGLDAVLDELNRLHPGGTKTPTALPTGEYGRPARKDLSAAAMARSLMTGAFQPDDGDDSLGNFAATVDLPNSQGRDGSPMNPIRLSAISGSLTGRSSDSLSLSLSSSSSVTLPGTGSTATGQRAASRKLSYWQSVANIGRQVADALEYAHKQGILHRDVKPSNLLLDLRGTVWVTDFGLAKVAGPAGDNLTHTGDILGTLRYMPPEAFEGRSDARSDVYSLGLTMYELLAMRPAYDEKDRNRLIKQVTSGEPTPLDRVNREIPRDLVTIVQKCIAREPSRRYATAEELAGDLHRFIEDEPILARRQTQVERYVRWARHNPGIATLGAALTAVLVIATIASLLVAGHMTNLARSEAKAADDERTARRDADDAKGREAAERKIADAARNDAEVSQRRAEESLKKAEENFAKARAAVNDYLTSVSEDDRLKQPGLQGLRIQLLQSALQFYQQFLKERIDDPTLRGELAGVYRKVADIYRDLQQPEAAKQSYTQALRLYQVLADDRPEDPAHRFGLALTHLRLNEPEPARRILERLIRPDDPKYHSELGEAYSQLARAGSRSNNRTGVLHFERKALEIRERLVAMKPNDPDARFQLAASYKAIAIGLKDEHKAEALFLLQRSLEQIESAYQMRHSDLHVADELSHALRNVALYARAADERDLAIRSLRRRAEVLDRLARENPTIPGYGTEMAEGYTELIELLGAERRWDDVRKVEEKASARIEDSGEETTDFFQHVADFHRAVHEVAIKRNRSDPENPIDLEPSAATLVAAYRKYVLAGGNEFQTIRNAARNLELTMRADFRALQARLDELGPAHATAANVNATDDGKLLARRTILRSLEALAGSDSKERFVRRHLARARLDLAQAQLVTGRIGEAKASFEEALAERRNLVAAFPSNETLLADLAQTQAAAGDFFASAGKLADAFATWNRAIETLEANLFKNPNSIPFRSALSERLIASAERYGNLGLWDKAAQSYSRAFQLVPSLGYLPWYSQVLVLANANDTSGMATRIDELVRLKPPLVGAEGIQVARSMVVDAGVARRHPTELQRILATDSSDFWYRWTRGLAWLRLGEPADAVKALETLPDDWHPKWPALALALRAAGKAEPAKEALLQADRNAERLVRDSLKNSELKVPMGWWQEWAHMELCRCEAHRAIHGRDLSESPYHRLFRGRALVALGDEAGGESEFDAAVAIRPDDADVWMARSNLHAKLDRPDKMANDLLKAQALRADEPKTWIETGRLLAERGEIRGAVTAYARASALGKGELNRFLESGWWAVGPYPDHFDSSYPPERDPDPSKLVETLTRADAIAWRNVPTHVPSGNIQLAEFVGANRNATYYALAHVYADRDRTASLLVRSASDMRIWLNGTCAFDGFSAWGLAPGGETHVVPVRLRSGLNRLLVKVHSRNPWCECQFHDNQAQLASDLMARGLWAEAADRWTEADRRGSLDPWRAMFRTRAMLAIGRDDEANELFAREQMRLGDSAGDTSVVHVGMACHLPPGRLANADRLVAAFEKLARGEVRYHFSDAERHFWLAHIYVRANKLTEAEAALRKAIELDDRIAFHPLLATVLHYRGQADAARDALAAVEARYAERLRAARDAESNHFVLPGEDALIYRVAHREATRLVRGKAAEPSADERVIETGIRKRFESQAANEDHYELRAAADPENPRSWVDLGRRLGELNRWDEATRAFDKAVVLRSDDASVWRERARARAELGKWDDAAADFVQALERSGANSSDWFAVSPIHDAIVRDDDVLARVAKRRPNDRQLWIRRVHRLARAANWSEAAKAIARVTELDPDDHLSWHFRGTLAAAGDTKAYTAIAREMLERFKDQTDDTVLQRIGTAIVIAPGFDKPGEVIRLMDRVKPNRERMGDWYGVTFALAHYRAGAWDESLKAIDSIVRAMEYTDVAALAIRAMVHWRQNRVDDARMELQLAREGLARFAKPGHGEAQLNWYNWLQANLLVREAEALIPPPPAPAVARSDPNSRDRKEIADRMAIRLALAQLSLDGGQWKEAEAELRAVVTEIDKVAEGDSSDGEFRTRRAIARIQLGRLLCETDRFAEGIGLIRESVAVLAKANERDAAARRTRSGVVADLLKSGDALRRGNRPRDALRLVECARSSLPIDETSDAEKTLVAECEYRIGELYASHGLLAEAAANLSAASWPERVDIWKRIRGAELRYLAGKPEDIRYVAERSLRNESDSTNAWTLTAVAVANVVTPEGTKDAKRLLELARRAAAGTTPTDGRWLQVAACELRAGLYQDVIQRADSPAFRQTRWGLPILALAQHRLGRADAAKELLSQAVERLQAHRRNRAFASSVVFDSNWETLLDALCLTGEAHLAILVKPLPDDPFERFARARAFLHFGESAKANTELARLPGTDSSDPAILLAWSRIRDGQGRLPEAAALRSKARAIAETAVTNNPGDTLAAEVLTKLLELELRPDWTVLTPVKVESQNGATLAIQSDQSVLAYGWNPKTDVYHFEAEFDGPIRSVRLEAIPDPSMPNGGCGRTGNFILSDFKATVGDAAATWSNVTADFSQTSPMGPAYHHPVSQAIDADPSSGWAVFPKTAEPHWAVFTTTGPLGGAGRNRIVIRLGFENKDWIQHALGRFRISVSEKTEFDSRPNLLLAVVSPHARIGAMTLAKGEVKEARDFLRRATAANPKPNTDDWLVLALAGARLGEGDAARAACAKAAAAIGATPAPESLRPLIREVALAVGIHHEEVARMAAAAAGPVPVMLNDAVVKNPDAVVGYRERSRWLMQNSRWKEAISDVSAIVRLEPNVNDAMVLAFLYAHIGDRDRYRAQIKTMAEKWGGSNNPFEIDQTLKAAMITPDSGIDAAIALRLANRIAAGDPKQQYREYYLFAKGLHDYRTGKPADAIVAAKGIRERVANWEDGPPFTMSLLLESLALHQLGKRAEAQSVLRQANEHLGRNVPGLGSDVGHDWLSLHILHREAAVTVNGMQEKRSGN